MNNFKHKKYLTSSIVLFVLVILLLVTQSLSAGTIEIEWLPDSIATIYDVEIARDRDFFMPVMTYETTETSASIEIEGFGWYYVRVAGRRGVIRGEWSEPREVLVLDPFYSAIYCPEYFYYIGIQYYFYGNPEAAVLYFEKAQEVSHELQFMSADFNDEFADYVPQFIIANPETVTINNKQYLVSNPVYFRLPAEITNFVSLQLVEIQEIISRREYEQAREKLNKVLHFFPFNRNALNLMIRFYNIIGNPDMARYYQDRLNLINQNNRR